MRRPVFFVDLSVSAAAPGHLAAAGFGDCLCRSVAQIDWWMSHRILGSIYFDEPYLIEMPDEAELNNRAHLLPGGDIDAVGYLYRVLTLCGLGISFTGISNHGSMGEHQISHYIDCFAGDRHPGTLHGQQVGVASLTMARIQRHFLSSETPPVVGPTRIDADDMARRMGAEIAAQCLTEYQKKAFVPTSADAVNEKLAELWPTLRRECLDMMLPVEEMQRLLKSACGATSARELGLSVDFYREACAPRPRNAGPVFICRHRLRQRCPGRTGCGRKLIDAADCRHARRNSRADHCGVYRY